MKSAIPSNKINGDFIHMVFFWLKNPDSVSDREEFKNALTKFINTNPQVVCSHIGEPATTDRPVIENSYTYSLVVTFLDLANQDAYQEDPTHLLFTEQGKALWEKVLIYDSLAL